MMVPIPPVEARPSSTGEQFSKGDRVFRRGLPCTVVHVDHSTDPVSVVVRCEDGREIGTEVHLLEREEPPKSAESVHLYQTRLPPAVTMNQLPQVSPQAETWKMGHRNEDEDDDEGLYPPPPGAWMPADSEEQTDRVNRENVPRLPLG